MTCSRIPTPLGPAETLQANGIPWRGPSGGTGGPGGPSGTISGDQWVTHGGTIFVLYHLGGDRDHPGTILGALASGLLGYVLSPPMDC